MISLAFVSSTGFAKEKSTDTKTTSGKKVDMTGTVKNTTGVCSMEGAKWDLLSNVGQPIHLAAGNHGAGKMLDQAAKTKKPVRVEGTQVAGVECPHVKVDKVTPAK
jgi:hypothetical protein